MVKTVVIGVCYCAGMSFIHYSINLIAVKCAVKNLHLIDITVKVTPISRVIGSYEKRITIGS